MKHSHFLITLFNLALWPADKSNSPTRTEQWLDSRCRLFEQWCLPSVIAQKGASFRWLVMFDADSPASLRERIARWQRLCPALEPCFFTAAQVQGFAGRSVDRQVDFILSAIKERLDGSEEWLLTTNLDNDDALASDALSRISETFTRKPALGVISLVNGLQLFPSLGVAAKMSYPHNHFLTLCEPLGPGAMPLTVESMSHRRARKMFPVTDLKGAPGWIEVVHGCNISNDLRITSRIHYRYPLTAVSLRPFGIDLLISRSRQLRALPAFAAMMLRVASRRLLRKLRKH